MNIEKYLSRIKYSGSTEPTLNVLKKLQRNHLLHVPFENLDIHYKRPIELSIDLIFEKIVTKNRGGFCYELNGLFYELLKALNFDVKIISARVYNPKKGYSEEYDHLAIIVKIDNTEYITDVGFGDFTFEPLQFNLNTIQKDERGAYIIDTYDEDYFRVNKMVKKIKTPEYIFNPKSRDFQEFKGMCLYHQTNSNSHFTKKRLISLPTENGRITITGNKLKIAEFDQVNESEILDEMDFNEKLMTLFNVNIL